MSRIEGTGNLHPIGIRPRQFDEVAANEVLERMMSGETLRTICLDAHMPTNITIWEWTCGKLGARPTWINDYARARQKQADAFVADTIALADLTDETAHTAALTTLNNLPEDASDTVRRRTYFYAKKRSIEGTKLMIDARKWVASRMAPGRWGDKVTIEHVGDENKPIAVDMSQLTTTQLEKIQRLQKEITHGTEPETEPASGVKRIASGTEQG